MKPPSDARRISAEGLDISFQVSPSINYALYHCHVPVIHDLGIKNVGQEKISAVDLSFDVTGYCRPWTKIVKNLAPGESVHLGKVPLELRYERLEGLEGRRYADFVVEVDGKRFHTEEIGILGFYEWSLDRSARKSLACFIQPAHPLVYQIVADADVLLGSGDLSLSLDRILARNAGDDVHTILETIYEALCTRYNIRYAKEAPSYELESQVIRPPHRVIPNPRRKTGAGTCVDLALLLASCLENLHLQPLILLLREKERDSTRHAILGCWTEIGERFEPILTNQSQIEQLVKKGRLILLEPTGLTQRFGH